MVHQRFVVIALDAASPQLLRAWAADGTMPNLQRLMAVGLSGAIEGLDGFYIGATWPSFSTGVNPGRHGFHYQLQLEPGTYHLRSVADGEPTKVSPFWRALSDAGRRVAVLDVPLSRLDPRINGVQVVEWGVHDELYGFATVPSGLASGLLARYGAHPIGSHCDGARRSAEDYEAFSNKLVRAVDTKTRLTQELMNREPWDFLIQVFSEAHCVGHQCWHLHDPSHPAFESGKAERLGDPVRRVYRALDSAVGQLVEASRDSTCIVMSAHGMTHWYGVTFLLRDILFALGVATPSGHEGSNTRADSIVYRRVWEHFPAAARETLASLRNRFRQLPPPAQPTLTRGIDASRSKCFPVGNGLGTGAIRLNVAGREPAGVLQPGAEVEAFIAEVTRDFMALTDADSGVSLVDRVVRVDNSFHGASLDVLPDLVIEWSRRRPVGSTELGDGAGAIVRVRHPRFGVVEGANGYGRAGEHEPGGFFVAVGPQVNKGASTPAVSLLDFAPTICRALECPLDDRDGRPIDKLLGSEGTSAAATNFAA